MTEDNQANGPSPSFTDLFPGIEKDKLQEAEENLDRYLELVLRIYNRIRSDPEAYRAFRALTSKGQSHNINFKGSNPPG